MIMAFPTSAIHADDMLLKRRVANVGDEPAVTKAQQCTS